MFDKCINKYYFINNLNIWLIMDKKNDLENMLTIVKDMGLTQLRLILTKKCLAKCPECHREGFYNDGTEINLSENDYRNIAKTFKGTFRTTKLSGGEPLLCKNIGQIANIFSSEGYNVTITTNGFVLDQKKAMMLKNNGVSKINITFPSFLPEIYKEWFGIKDSNIQARVLSEIKKIRNVFDNVDVNIPVTNPELFINEIHNFCSLSSDFGVKISVFLTHNIKHKEESFQSSIKRELFIKEEELGDKYNTIYTNNGAIITLFVDLHNNAIKYKKSDICKNCLNNGICIEGAYALRIDEYGNIQTCMRNPYKFSKIQYLLKNR